MSIFLNKYSACFLVTCTLLANSVFAPFAHAQIVSGFMGKRATITYQYTSFPAFVSGIIESNAFNLQSKHALEADYLVRRRLALGVSLKGYQTVVPFYRQDVEYDYTWKDPDDVWNDYYGEELERPKGTGKANVLHGGLYLKLWGDNNLAPLGTYSKFFADYIFCKMNASQDQFMPKNIDTRKTYNLSAFKGKDSYSTGMIGYAVGRQRVYWDNLLINVSAQIGWVFGGLKANDAAGYIPPFIFIREIGEVTPIQSREFVSLTTKAQLQRSNFLGISLGIGFIR